MGLGAAADRSEVASWLLVGPTHRGVTGLSQGREEVSELPCQHFAVPVSSAQAGSNYSCGSKQQQQPPKRSGRKQDARHGVVQS